MSPTRSPVAAVRTAERPGSDHPSEDRIFTTDNAVIVLDGASQPDPSEHDGGWLADTLGREVQRRLASAGDLAQILADAIATVADEHRLMPGAGPSSTVSIVRWDDQIVDVLVLGDSPVLALTHDGAVLEVRDDRLRRTAKNQRQRLQDAGLTGPPAKRHELWRLLVDAERAERNTAGGYWIAEAVPDAARHAIRATWNRSDLAAVLAITDGVYAGIDRYGTSSNLPDVFALASVDPAHLLDAVHGAETSDPDCVRWPRSKRHDDKAIAHIQFNTLDSKGRRT